MRRTSSQEVLKSGPACLQVGALSALPGLEIATSPYPEGLSFRLTHSDKEVFEAASEFRAAGLQKSCSQIVAFGLEQSPPSSVGLAACLQN